MSLANRYRSECISKSQLWAANRATTSSNQISKRHCRLTHSLYSLYSLPSLHSRTHCTHALTVLTALTVLKHSRTHCTHCTQLKLKCQPAAVLQMARVINSDPSSETLSSTNQRNQSDSCRGSNLQAKRVINSNPSWEIAAVTNKLPCREILLSASQHQRRTVAQLVRCQHVNECWMIS